MDARLAKRTLYEILHGHQEWRAVSFWFLTSGLARVLCGSDDLGVSLVLHSKALPQQAVTTG